MIRVVLTVLVAVALMSASMPALESARTATTADRLESEADRIERAIAGVAAGSVAAEEPSLAARTTTTVRVPSGFTAARLERVALVDTRQAERTRPTERTERTRSDTDPVDVGHGSNVVFVYRIDGGPDRSVPVVPEIIAADVEVVGGSVALRPGGENRLELRFVDDGGPTVRIPTRLVAEPTSGARVLLRDRMERTIEAEAARAGDAAAEKVGERAAAELG